MNVKELLSITNEEEILTLKTILKYSEERNYINKKKSSNFVELSYQDVWDIKVMIMGGDFINATTRLLNVDKSKILKVNSKDFVPFIKFMTNQLNFINELEAKLNDVDTTDDFDRQQDLQAAGVQKLQKYGIINVVDELANGKIWDWDKVKNTRYWDVYIKLMKDKDKASISAAYNKIVTSKNKRNG